MQQPRTHRISRPRAWGVVAVLTFLLPAGAPVASAQVVIDMPPPKPRPRAVTPPPPAPADAATPATVLDAPPPPKAQPEPGALAFQQYTRTRYLPIDRYGRVRRPFQPGDFTRSFIEHGLLSPFRVVAPSQIIIVSPPPIIIKPPGVGE